MNKAIVADILFLFLLQILHCETQLMKGNVPECVKGIQHHTCVCPIGYQKTQSNECEDIDECKNLTTSYCGKNTICDNNDGGHSCNCVQGFEYDLDAISTGSKMSCKDVDECSRKDSCHEKATCSNIAGSYKCTCNSGLGGDGYTFCSILQPCPAAGTPCKKKNRVCKEIDGLKLCDCKDGYYMILNDSCVDIDECVREPLLCGSNSVCSNTAGSFKCNCNAGFESKTNDGKHCIEKDYCKNKDKNCGGVAECESLVGSYRCYCPDGFTFDGKTKQCLDADECAVAKSPCGSNLQCINKLGSYSCDCRKGYRITKDKLSCTDIDECKEGNYNCPKFAKCENKNGSYECPCEDGYEKTSQEACRAAGVLESLGSLSLGSSGVSLRSGFLFFTAALFWLAPL